MKELYAYQFDILHYRMLKMNLKNNFNIYIYNNNKSWIMDTQFVNICRVKFRLQN